MDPVFWLAVAAVMALVEVLSFGLITVWFVVGALVAFVSGLLGADYLIQSIVFLVISVGCLLSLRPVFVKRRKDNDNLEPTNVGVQAVVCESINNDLMIGRVETPDHLTWIARSADGFPIEQGVQVVVVGQESVKLIVERKMS